MSATATDASAKALASVDLSKPDWADALWDALGPEARQALIAGCRAADAKWRVQQDQKP